MPYLHSCEKHIIAQIRMQNYVVIHLALKVADFTLTFLLFTKKNLGYRFD